MASDALMAPRPGPEVPRAAPISALDHEQARMLETREFYRHRQFGAGMLAGVLPAIAIFIVSRHMAPSHWGLLPMRALSIAAAVIGIVLINFATLEIRVDSETIRWRYNFGPIGGRRALAEIESARVIETQWFWGWGIRLTPRGTLYKVGGLGAIELTMKDGRHVLLGSDEPVRLKNALDRARESLADERGW